MKMKEMEDKHAKENQTNLATIQQEREQSKKFQEDTNSKLTNYETQLSNQKAQLFHLGFNIKNFSYPPNISPPTLF